MSNDNNSFEYTYSAKDQTEIRKIREKYCPSEKQEPDTLDKLRMLDNSVSQKATIFSLVFGIIGTIIMGFGMSLTMTQIGSNLGIKHPMLIGIIIGLFGIASVISAYPVYNFIIKRERARIAPEILRLTDELLK